MKNISEHTLACLRDEKERLLEDVRRCDFCSTKVTEHAQCLEETAKLSGRRARACFI